MTSNFFLSRDFLGGSGRRMLKSVIKANLPPRAD